MQSFSLGHVVSAAGSVTLPLADQTPCASCSPSGAALLNTFTNFNNYMPGDLSAMDA